MFDIKPASIDYNGETYYLELSLITKTRLGLDNINSFIIGLELEYNGVVTEFNLVETGKESELVGGFAMAVLELVGARVWENLVGKKVFALRRGKSLKIAGLMNENYDKILILQDLCERLRENIAVASDRSLVTV